MRTSDAGPKVPSRPFRYFASAAGSYLAAAMSRTHRGAFFAARIVAFFLLFIPFIFLPLPSLRTGSTRLSSKDAPYPISLSQKGRGTVGRTLRRGTFPVRASRTPLGNPSSVSGGTVGLSIPAPAASPARSCTGSLLASGRGFEGDMQSRLRGTVRRRRPKLPIFLERECETR